MEEARGLGGGGGGGDSSSAARAASSFEKVGDRTRFTVELRPGETTIVSWKKLMKDASKASGSAPAAVSAPSAREPSSSSVHPALESRLAPGQAASNELKDTAPPNRFNAVIEKIERLYMGKDSSDDEDLDDIPDEEQYDTEDSFIDDAELDEYFEVDKLKTKHDGFFVNRGKLESIESSLSPAQQPKKRRRKEMVKGMGESDCCHKPNKHLKVEREGTGKTVVSVQNNTLPTAPIPGTHPQKMVSDYKPELHAGASLKVTDGDAAKVTDDKLKEATEFSDSGHIKYYETSGSTHLKVQSGKAKNAEELENSFRQREKSGNRQRIDLNVAAGKHPIQNVKSSLFHKREGSSFKPKGNMLDKAIRELEKMVAESRPPVGDFQDVDATYQGTKRRLPQEIKQKLAKVARVAQVSHGKVSKELLNRLMSILGHLINVRTLKRNLKIMISESLSANQEKDNKIQQIKKEVVEMIKARGPSLISKATEQQLVGSDDFQESRFEGKGAMKVKYYMDAALEDKICDLYDIFVDGLDDDIAPQARKLYAELAELWPKGAMDNHGIKRAICHAKERRRVLHDRDQERIKRRNIVATEMDETGQADSSVAQPQSVEGGAFANFGTHVVGYPYPNKFTSSVATNPTTTNPTSLALPLLDPSSNAQNFDRSKHEKAKASATGTNGEVLVKKKIKRKPETNSGEAHCRPEVSQHSEERQRTHGQQTAGSLVSAAPQKSGFQLAAAPSFEQLT